MDVDTVGKIPMENKLKLMIEQGTLSPGFPYSTKHDQTLLNKLHTTYKSCVDFPNQEPSLQLSSVKAILAAYDWGLQRHPVRALIQGLISSMKVTGPVFFRIQGKSSGRQSPSSAWGLSNSPSLIPTQIDQVKQNLMQIKQLDELEYPVGRIHMVPLLWKNEPIDSIAARVVKLVLALRGLSQSPDANVLSQAIPMDDFEREAPNFPWKQFFNIAMNTVLKVPCSGPNMHRCHAGGVSAVNLPYFKKLGTLLTQSEPGLIRLILALEAMAQTRALISQVPQSLRVDFCKKKTIEMFPLILSRWNTDPGFQNEDRNRVMQLFNSIRQVAQQKVKNLPYWDGPTKNHAILKLEYMKLDIGLPNVLLKVQDLEQFHQGYQPHLTQWLTTLQSFTEFQFFSELISIYSPEHHTVTKYDALFHSIAVYERERNAVIISSHTLGSSYPKYTRDMPDSILYGTLGTVLAHEIMHGLFLPGRFFGAQGGSHFWWTAQSAMGFKRSVETHLVSEFSNYRVQLPENQLRSINGVETLAENVSDIAGFQLALAAFQQKEATNPSPLLPELPQWVSSKHLFHIAFAQYSCAHTTPSGYLKWLSNSKVRSHPPHDIRVFATIRHSPLFSELFRCPKQKEASPMCLARPLQVI
jgi:predicted metalloendopeptidase